MAYLAPWTGQCGPNLFREEGALRVSNKYDARPVREIRAKVVDMGDGKRLKMNRYWMEVPSSIKLEVGKPTWVVVDHLHYEEPDDSGKKPFVVRAVAVLNGDMFPG